MDNSNNSNISKVVGVDEETGLQIRVDITGVAINLKSKTVDITYDENLIGKTGKVITKRSGVYTRRNSPAVIDIRQVEGEEPGITEEYEVSPESNKFDELSNSEVGALIKGMLENDLKNYPKL